MLPSIPGGLSAASRCCTPSGTFLPTCGLRRRTIKLNVWSPADFVYKISSLILLLNDSANGFSQAELGGMYFVPAPLPTHHA
jgi:hypothetical protein